MCVELSLANSAHQRSGDESGRRPAASRNTPRVLPEEFQTELEESEEESDISCSLQSSDKEYEPSSSEPESMCDHTPSREREVVSPHLPEEVAVRDIEGWIERSPRRRKKPSREQRMANRLENHAFLGKCECKHHACMAEDLDEDSLRQINLEFWTSPYLAQTAFLEKHAVKMPVKRQRSVIAKKTYTMNYTLPKIPNKVTVCKRMFLNTLGTQSYALLERLAANNANDSFVQRDDQRGKNKKSNAFSDEKNALIKNHILSFNPCISHYRREHAPRRFYLPSELTVKQMFDDFKVKHPNEKLQYPTYAKFLKGMNISFTKLGGEECHICEEMKTHIHNEGENDCKDCEQWAKHTEDYRIARNMYEEDRAKNGNYYSVDMQKVVILPVLSHHAKKAAFVSRLVVFNETFVPLGGSRNKKILSVIWHEGITGRNADDVSTCFFLALKNLNKASVTLWMDNCSGQNKNWYLFQAMVFLVNQNDGPDSVEFKYLTAGHTSMSADSFHAAIERKKKKIGDVYTVDDFCDIVRSSTANVEILNMGKKILFTNKTRARSNLPKLGPIKVAKFQRGKTTLAFKLSHATENFVEVEFLPKALTKTVKNGNLPQECNTMRGIPSAKKNKINDELGPLMSERGRRFFDSLIVSEEAADLQLEDED